jgi:Sulfatase-modifying factor enzyme 1
MQLIPGGTFRMGSDKHYAEETPAHRVKVHPLWIDPTPITNRQQRPPAARPWLAQVARTTPARIESFYIATAGWGPYEPRPSTVLGERGGEGPPRLSTINLWSHDRRRVHSAARNCPTP